MTLSSGVTIRYLERVRHLLIARQDRGITQHDLNQKARVPKGASHEGTTAADLKEVLEHWQARRWVDKFTQQPLMGSPETRWRATVLLRDEWVTVTTLNQLVVLFAAGEISIDPLVLSLVQEQNVDPLGSSPEQSSDP